MFVLVGGRGSESAVLRIARHLDGLRSEEELWGSEVAPLGVGPLVEVDTAAPVDVAALADRIRSLRST